ncbi:hypothetical protein SNE25_00195 [Mucilaginibacter sabulilitoris]|uniref:CARDB domain-containing protein n=1 Tax=Mucilaginibacter sabulilitoris TaxID=1173583 RepID=A0ABZ0TLJ6_9SPHI|nr:hypothetical protein [Mucilaginibacter sabulilitoris]WPU93943.1 hypothetical protein SNE25_00195 [Mucilaginibacter sabulilitoris]
MSILKKFLNYLVTLILSFWQWLLKHLGILSAPKVVLVFDAGDYFVGSYTKVKLKITGSPVLTLDDLYFTIPDGPKAGTISLCQDKEFDPANPDIMLCIGYEPGDYRLQCYNKSTSALMSEEKFSVTTIWTDNKVGASRSFTGIVTGYSAGSAWGGGPAAPQNLNVIPQSGTKRIAVLLVDTSSERYSTTIADVQAIKDKWMNSLINGVTEGGITRSVKQFYREVSYNNIDITADVFGPVQLPADFDTYFNADGTTKGAFNQAAITAGDGLINYNNYEYLLCVSQPVHTTDAGGNIVRAKAAWPYSSIGKWGPYSTSEGDKSFGIMSMPHDWEEADGRKRYQTISHEFGHNLGLLDQYTPSVPGRNLDDWELMDFERNWPYFSVAHRMMLGWLPATNIVQYNFSSMATPVDQSTTLQPIEAAPAAGQASAIEVRIADGWNYYFEYRKGQAAELGDKQLPTDSVVFGTDVVSAPWVPPISRPVILLLNNDADGDGSVLTNGKDYKETDHTDPTFPTDFKVGVSGINGSNASVRVQYGVNSKPDPSIRPWPRPDHQYQSPDIEVRNDRNASNPEWFNVPWVGHDNTVAAQVRNNGSLDAPGVVVHFAVKDYNVGGAPESPLGTVVKDVPAGGAPIEFTTSWNPPAEGHFCIIVRIELYQRPDNPAIVEMTELNNLAQSNYDRFISASASPAERMITYVTVGNPYPVATQVYLIPDQTNPLYRSYAEFMWLWLEPAETRKIKLMFEYDHTNLFKGPLSLGVYESINVIASNNDHKINAEEIQRKYQDVPNKVNLACMIENPHDNPRHSKYVLGGAEVEVVTGKATQFVRFGNDGDTLYGQVLVKATKAPARGKVILELFFADVVKKYVTVKLDDNGQFFFRLDKDVKQILGYFLPDKGYGDCYSDLLKL